MAGLVEMLAHVYDTASNGPIRMPRGDVKDKIEPRTSITTFSSPHRDKESCYQSKGRLVRRSYPRVVEYGPKRSLKGTCNV
jgi:hypothetical protein